MILAADTFKTNSQLMLACRALGYLDDEKRIYDCTYGKGTWWKDWRPARLQFNSREDDPTFDFRDTGFEDDTFDVVCFDPPYVAVGGRKTSTIGDFNDAYGLVDVPTTPNELHELMVGGLQEAWRVLKPGGLCLFKCMNYVTSGKYRVQAYDALMDAYVVGFELHDEFIHLRKPGPQPKHDRCGRCGGTGNEFLSMYRKCSDCNGVGGTPRRQLHARRNYSHLFCLKAVK